jgi:hypothetical protein
MHAKRQCSSETTHVVQDTIGYQRQNFSSRFLEGEAVSNVRKFPFLEFSLITQGGSPVRESRSPGSVRGGTQQWVSLPRKTFRG